MPREQSTEVQRLAAKITREIEGRIYVREYTVKAHVRKRKPRRRKDH